MLNLIQSVVLLFSRRCFGDNLLYHSIFSPAGLKKVMKVKTNNKKPMMIK